MFSNQELSRLRSVANSVVADENERGPERFTVNVRPAPKGARIVVGLQSGAPRPDDPLLRLGAICDQIVTELRLERDETSRPVYRTEEPLFNSGDNPTFYFNVHPA